MHIFYAPWGNEDTQRILDILKKKNVRVTFFMTGEWINEYPEDVKAIDKAGHDIGNHSENHKQMTQLDEEKCKRELMVAHKRMKDLLGKDMFLFRPPYGAYNNQLLEIAEACKYYTIQWDVDSLDWKDYGADAIVKKVCEHKNLKNGSIILMHNGAKYTADALEKVIDTLREKGYDFVPISELIIKEDYHIDITGRQIPNEKPKSEIEDKNENAVSDTQEDLESDIDEDIQKETD